MKRYSRRQMLKILGASAAGGVAWKLGLKARDLGLVEVSESRILMGTVVNLTVIGGDRHAAELAASAALTHMADLEAILSRHQPNSELSRLNRTGRLNEASQPLLDVIAQSRQISAITNGAFDVTIKPLVDLYLDYHRRGALPPAATVTEIQQLVDYREVRVTGKAIAFAKPGMGITPDGIGKGYIVDAGAATLQAHGFNNVLVEASGDLMAAGEKQSDTPWLIGIQQPREALAATATRFNLANQAAATSGDYQQSFSSGFRHHHIIDPRTGFSNPDLASVSVKAPSAMLADGLATAIMALGYDAGLRLVDQLADVEALVITKSLRTWRSSRF